MFPAWRLFSTWSISKDASSILPPVMILPDVSGGGGGGARGGRGAGINITPGGEPVIDTSFLFLGY